MAAPGIGHGVSPGEEPADEAENLLAQARQCRVGIQRQACKESHFNRSLQDYYGKQHRERF